MSSLSKFFTDDHRACDEHWAQVESAADSGDDAAVGSFFKSFDLSMRRHLAWEEGILFPAFEQASGMRGGPTMVMRYEHTQMRAMLDQMKAAIEAGDPELLVDLGDTLLMLIQQHNAKEEQMLYPMAEGVLGDQWTGLKEQIQPAAL